MCDVGRGKGEGERRGREAGEGGGEESKSKRKGIDRVGQVNLVKVKQKPKRKILNTW